MEVTSVVLLRFLSGTLCSYNEDKSGNPSLGVSGRPRAAFRVVNTKGK